MKKRYAEIEEFEYTYKGYYDHAHLFRAKIITESEGIFGTSRKEFTIPFVFENKDTAQEFLQYDVKYEVSNFYFGSHNYSHCIPFYKLKINGYKCFAILNQYNTFNSNETVMSHLKSYRLIKYDNNIKIFRSLMLFEKGTHTNDIEIWVSELGHADIYSQCDIQGNSMSWSSIENFLNYKNNEKNPKVNANIKTIGTTKYELIKV